MPKRNDATLVYDIPMYKRIFPYLMKRRSDSIVYHSVILDLTKTIQFIKEQNKKYPDQHSYRVFEVLIAAIMRTIALRPQVNRFIANNEYWQRNELSLNFVIKEDYTDEAPEHSTPIYFEPDMTLPEMAAIIDKTIIEARSESADNFTDKAIGFFFKFPKWFIRLIIGVAKWLDKHGRAPQALREADGLHTSVFIANLGSIGLSGGSPHHHLYEWGTTSLFLTLGTLHRIRNVESGTTQFSDKMEVGITIDERIADGFYFMSTIKMFQDFLNNPAALLERPELPPPPPTKKEYKALLKAQKREAKQAVTN